MQTLTSRSIPNPKEPNRATVYPSLLAANFGNLREEMLRSVACEADGLHIDVMDGKFVQEITFGSNIVKLAKQTTPQLFRDVHLMIVEPRRHLENFGKAGAEALTIHQEACNSELAVALNEIRQLGMKSGVSIKPKTAVEDIFDVLHLCDMVLMMSVEPGAGGQAFIPETIDRIRALRTKIDADRLVIPIGVDGGINETTGLQCIEAGASILIAGSYLFKQVDMRPAIAKLRI